MIHARISSPGRARRSPLARGCALLVAFTFALAASGCSFNTLVANKLGDALASSGSGFGSDDDPELIGAAVPFSLKLMESVLTCTFFTSFTGASGVAILAIGGLAMPLLLAAGYSGRPALGLVTGGGLPGVLLFPAMPLILYAIVARTSIEAMFVGGFLPTLLMLGIALWWGTRQAPRPGP